MQQAPEQLSLLHAAGFHECPSFTPSAFMNPASYFDGDGGSIVLNKTGTIQVLDADQAAKVGVSSATELLQRSTVASGQQVDATLNTNAGNSNATEAPPTGGAGSSNIDLRGLGIERTLVLVNGQRSVPSTVSGLVPGVAMSTALPVWCSLYPGAALTVRICEMPVVSENHGAVTINLSVSDTSEGALDKNQLIKSIESAAVDKPTRRFPSIEAIRPANMIGAKFCICMMCCPSSCCGGAYCTGFS